MLIIIAITLLIGSGINSVSNGYKRELHYSHDAQEYVSEDHRIYTRGGVYTKATNLECYEIYEPSLGYPVTVMMIMAAIAPGWMFLMFKKKRNLDCFYSLPISRRTLGMIQYGLGLIAVYLPFLILYAQVILSNMASGLFGNLAHEYILCHFLLSILAGFVIYTLSAFVYNLANTSGDGYIFMISYQLAPLFLISCFNNLRREYMHSNNIYNYNSIPEEYGSSYSFFGELLSDFARKAERKYPDPLYDIDLNEDLIWLWIIIWAIVGALSLYGCYRIFADKRAESAEEVSETLFGYKTLIPICGFAGIISGLGDDFYFGLMFFDAAVIGYTIYRRGVRYKKSDVIILGSMFVLNLVLNVMYYSTH